jgi:hypothetical protein
MTTGFWLVHEFGPFPFWGVTVIVIRFCDGLVEPAGNP